MDNTLYVGLSRQMTLRREFDLLANNIANSDTVAFKVESLMVGVRPATPKGGGEGPINFALDSAVARDFGQGALKPTGNPMDVAISGEGFFKVSTPEGERYTRDGRFSMDGAGRLTTQNGDAVLGDGGEIVLDPKLGPPKIAEDGTVSQGAGAIGKLAVVRFANLSALSKEGDNLYSNVANVAPEAAGAAKLTQGSVEGSNVQAIAQITRLIEVSRAYESAAKMMDDAGQMDSQAIQRLGRVN